MADDTATNDITGDRIATKPNSSLFRENFDKIFGPSTQNLNWPTDQEITTLAGEPNE